MDERRARRGIARVWTVGLCVSGVVAEMLVPAPADAADHAGVYVAAQDAGKVGDVVALATSNAVLEPETHAEPVTSSAKDAPDPAKSSSELRHREVFNQSLFNVEVGGEAAGRQFGYRDGISNDLRAYNVAPAAMVSAAAEVFPFADAAGVLRDIGLNGSYAHSLFLKSALTGGKDVSTAESAYTFGLRLRIHPWGDNGSLIGVSYQYAGQAFQFDSAGGAVDGQVPSVDYRANRIAVDARVPFGSLAAIAGVGFRAVLSAGGVESRFRAPSVDGIDGEFGASLTVAPGWEARLVLDYERYFYSFQPVPGDEYVAGGALDQFFGGRLAVAYVF
jgi:hypothetical protein